MTTTTPAPTTTHSGGLPHPLVTWRHPFRKTWQTLVTLVLAVIAGHVGRYVWVTIYYQLTQNRWVKPHWDGLLTPVLGQEAWDFARHFLRDGVQYELAATFVWLMLTNPWSKKMRKDPNVIERGLARVGMPTRAQTHRTTWWQFLLSPGMVVLAGIPGFAAVYGVDLLVQWGILHHAIHDTTSVPTNQGVLATWAKSNTSKWLPHVAGVAGGVFFGRLVFNKVALDTMELMAARQLWQRKTSQRLLHPFAGKLSELLVRTGRLNPDHVYGQKPGIWKPPAYRAMYTVLKDRRAAGVWVPRPGKGLTVAIMLVIPLLLLAAWRGWYILQYIA